jgi:hypothetical protein
MLKSNPIVQRLMGRSNFTSAATVETGRGVDLQQARAWCIPTQQTRVRNLTGRALPTPIFGHERVLWSFEFEADAILFACRFGGIVRGPISVSDWRRDHI